MSALKGVLFFVPNLLLWLAAFITITVPTWLFGLASQSLTITMTFTTLLLILGLFGAAVTWLVRYRLLNVYSRLPPEPQRKEPQIDLVPEVQAGDSKRGLSSYLDEFLEAIKIFGYLERPVFHELTRTMQTKKLLAGETLSMEEEKGFGIVVDGHVQIFVRAQKPERSQRNGFYHEGQDDSDDDLTGKSGQQGYQLLTDVRNGAPMSSLFSILALFTEDIRLRYDEDDHDTPLHTGTSAMAFAVRKHSRSIPHSPYYGNTFVNTNHLRDMRSPRANDALSPVPPLSLDSREGPRPSSVGPGPKSAHHRNDSTNRQTNHPEVVIRACTDTTIAVIPPSAFKRLTRTYPKAAAHIVQVILNKLQRVTLASAHSYLGLAEEVLKTEKEIARLTFYELPNHLRGSALERLRAKFAAERSRLGEETDNHKGIALHNSSLKRNRRTSSNAQRDLLAQLKIKALNAMQQQAPALDSRGFSQSRMGISAGDLITNIQIPRKPRLDVSDSILDDKRISEALISPSATSPLALMDRSPFVESPRKALIRQESLDEDDIFRTSICQCITKAIGLTNPRNGLLNRTADSVEQSPRLVSYDARRYSATFANAFGTMDAFEGSTDGDDDSVASSSLNLSVPTFQQTQTELKDDIEIVYFPAGAVLVEEGERNPGLYYVIDGFLEVSASLKDETETADISINNTLDQDGDGLPKSNQRSSENHTKKRGAGPGHKSASKVLYKIKPGGLAGYIGSISSYRSFVDITAKTDVYVGFLTRASLEKLVDRFPVVLMTMAKRLTTLLPTLIQHIDFALEWIQVNAGEVLYNQGEESDAIYIVLNGRLRALKDKDKSTMRLAGEYGQGDSVGELDVLTESLRPTTLHAIRDTEVARLPKTLFNSLSLEHPGITIRISKIIAQRMRSLLESPLSKQVLEKRAATKSKNAKSTTNLRTVAILPVTTGVPVVEFSNKLLSAFNHVGMANGVTVLNQAGILNHLGRHAFSRMGKLKLSQYLADLEEQYSMLLYVADTNVTSPWTQTCIGQADCILLVALAEDSTEIGEFERFLLGTKSTARKDLVLLHPERYSPPGLTRKWLQNRPWINGGHHHIQMLYHVNPQPISPQSRPIGKSIKQRVQVIQAGIQKYTSRRIRQTPLYSTDTPFKGDFHRLARRLCGKSVGLVLGGGGARGIAHVGIISAFEEAGIPIDLVGGTSIGSFIGALYAKDADVVPMYGRAKKFAGRMGSMWRFALDLTYPSVSYTTGHEFNRGIFKAFGNAQIEDFWLEFYCNTVNISKSRPEIHNSGYAWRYVRASMTLVGLLPPLCDEGDMLLDGGYIDNLTVGHMKSLGADAIFAIDVGALDDDSPQNFGDSLSGLWTIVNRWNPFSSYTNPPTLSEIQARLAYVSSVDALERAKQIHGCLYMRPPVELYGTLDFSKFDEIYQIGYKYGTEYLTKLREKGVLPVMEETEDKKNLRRTMAPRRASI